MKAEDFLGKEIGGYAIERVLGEGASSWVFRGSSGAVRRAIKVYKPSFFDEYATIEGGRIQRALRVASRIHHPSLAMPLESGFAKIDARSICYVVMELVEGQNLSAVVRDRGPLDPTTFAAIALQIVGAVEALHNAQAIHRDIKPENIVIGADGTAVLVDFGVIRDLDSPSVLTDEAKFLGSYRYAAREYQLGTEGASLDPAIDRYALGATFAEMITGKPPFHEHKTKAAVIIRAAQGPPAVITPPTLVIFSRSRAAFFRLSPVTDRCFPR